MSTSKVIKQGDSLGLSYSTNPQQNMTAWTCRVVVKNQKDDVTPLIDINLTVTSSDTFSKIGMLTPAQTGALPPGCYHLCAELALASTDESAEVHEVFEVQEQAVF